MATAKEDLNLPMILTIGILFVVLVFVLILLLQSYFYEVERSEYYTKIVAPRSESLASALADQQQKLRGYRWVDQTDGVVGIPIERAMALVVREGVPTPPATPDQEAGIGDETDGEPGGGAGDGADNGADGEPGGDQRTDRPAKAANQ
ncbi:MAG: hypothetical protein R6X25_00170 [Candidatus Krumholzibacteriia bacterium]